MVIVVERLGEFGYDSMILSLEGGNFIMLKIIVCKNELLDDVFWCFKCIVLCNGIL